MNTKNELLAKITELESTTAKLKEQVSSMVVSGVDVPWFPEECENYYYLGTEGEIRYWVWSTGVVCQGHLAFGNVYKTEEQAEIALDRRLAEVRVLRRIAELNAEQGWTACFDGKQDNCHIGIRKAGELAWDSHRNGRSLPIEYYGSFKTIKTIMAEMEDDYRLMLGVGNNGGIQNARS